LIRLPILVLAGLAASCSAEPSQKFPDAHRPVAPIVSSRWSNEEARDRLNEADKIMDMANVAPNMTVADIGAGEGYYTVRLSKRVGSGGRVVAEDIVPEVKDLLAKRILKEKLDNVSVTLGTPDDPKLPAKSFDRILLIHMYHEISAPYAFLWNLRPALRQGGRVIIVDADRSTAQHGTPPMLLQCEFAAIGYKMVEFRETAFAGGYFAAFEAMGERPAPKAIKACKLPN
jgi:ubiquinone/menaquinone biosynthesis C-methylase UbiE